MSEDKHIHKDDIIVDADEHFIINTTTRLISNSLNKKVSIMQYDNKSERYSFDIDKEIDGHDLSKCNRIQIHFINVGSNRQQNPGVYVVDDANENKSDKNKITFTWLIGQEATLLSGVLKFLVSFECVEGDKVLYRWSTAPYSGIQVVTGMDNDNAVYELYSDALLSWQHVMETEFLPDLVNDLYINREFATAEEVAKIFDVKEV